MQKVTTPKQVQVIARYEIKRNGHVVYQLHSSSGQDIYTATLVNGKATGCSCPAYKPCYHMTQLEAREAARSESRQQVSTPAVQQFEEGQEVVYSYCSGIAFTGIIVSKRIRLNGEDGYMLQTKLWTEVVPIRFLTSAEQVAAVEESKAEARAAFVESFDPCMVA